MHNLKPKKHLGQHFLTDQGIALRITELLRAESSDQVVEIGPGKGVLSQYLMEQFENLRLIEVDPEAITYLTATFDPSKFELVHQDILKWDWAQGTPPDSHFIGNLPYNISSPIFFKLLEHQPQVKEAVFMIQKEVAQRICEGPGSKTYGILSVLLGAYFELEYAFTVGPGAFHPPPKVQSAVIRLTRRDNPPEVEFPQLKRVVKQAFSQRRKTLRNALKGLSFKDFEEKAFWMTKRAEQLGVADFVKLTKMLG